MRVFIYFNLHKKCWSIKALEGENRGRVIKHTDAWTVENATFKVSEAGRQRVLREKRKNVHAGVVGKLVDFIATGIDNAIPVTYNPYRAATFVVADEGRAPIYTANMVSANGRSVMAV